MPSIATKESLLKTAGFRYNFHRELFVNRANKKAFSVEFVDDHTPAELEQRIRDATGTGQWQFYFNEPPSEYVRDELTRLLG